MKYGFFRGCDVFIIFGRVNGRAGKNIDFPKNRLIDFPEEKNRFKIDFSFFSILPYFYHFSLKIH